MRKFRNILKFSASFRPPPPPCHSPKTPPDAPPLWRTGTAAQADLAPRTDQPYRTGLLGRPGPPVALGRLAGPGCRRQRSAACLLMAPPCKTILLYCTFSKYSAPVYQIIRKVEINYLTMFTKLKCLTVCGTRAYYRNVIEVYII